MMTAWPRWTERLTGPTSSDNVTTAPRHSSETPKPGDPRLAGGIVDILVTPRDALQAAADLARANGVAIDAPALRR